MADVLGVEVHLLAKRYHHRLGALSPGIRNQLLRAAVFAGVCNRHARRDSIGPPTSGPSLASDLRLRAVFRHPRCDV